MCEAVGAKLHFVVLQSEPRVERVSISFDLDVDSDDQRRSAAPGLLAGSEDFVAQVRPAKRCARI